MWEEYGNVRVVKTGSYSIHDDGNKVIEDENDNEIVVNGNDGAFWIELRILSITNIVSKNMIAMNQKMPRQGVASLSGEHCDVR